MINSSSLEQDNDQVLSVESELSSQGELKKEEYDYQNEEYENDEYGGEFRRSNYEETSAEDFFVDINEKSITVVSIDDLDKESSTEDQELDIPDEESTISDQELDIPDEESSINDQELDTPEEKSTTDDQEVDTPEEKITTDDQELDTPEEKSTTDDQKLDTPEKKSTTDDQELDTPEEKSFIEDQEEETLDEANSIEDQELDTQDEENTTEDQELVTLDDINTTKDQELVTSEKESTTKDQEEETSDEESTTENQELDNQDEKSHIEDQELVTQEEETTTEDQEEDSPDEESTIADQELDGAKDQELNTQDVESSIEDQEIDTSDKESSIEDQDLDNQDEETPIEDQELITPEGVISTKDQDEDTPDEESTTGDQELVIPEEEDGANDQDLDAPDEESSIEDQEIDTSNEESSIEDQELYTPDEGSYLEDQDYFIGEPKEILFQDEVPKTNKSETIPSLIESAINNLQDEFINIDTKLRSAIDVNITYEDTDLEPDKLFRGISELEEDYTDEGFARTFSNDVLRTTTARVNTGTVRGKVLRTLSGFEITWYPGIPYAEPPVGDLRFQVARRKSSWTGLLEGRERVKCVQASSFNVEGEEDCLYLNIWVPETSNSTQLLPVMVWIHGGFFLFGSGDAEYQSFHRLVEKNMIVVSINYRLGALGFLCLGNDMSGGNLGLRDQKLAMEWVQQNILNFGGDPGRVTVFGQGSGAMSTQVHLLSPSSRRFISGAILQSGSLLYKTKFEQVTEDVIKSSQRLADSFGCSGFNTLNCLRNISANLLTRKSVARDETFNESGIYSNSSWFWLPVQDGNFSRDPLIPKPPVEILLAGIFNLSGENNITYTVRPRKL